MDSPLAFPSHSWVLPYKLMSADKFLILVVAWSTVGLIISRNDVRRVIIHLIAEHSMPI